MVTILSNVAALAASRQLGTSKVGLNQAITRLTTGRRVNNASDDEQSLISGNTAQANSRKYGAQVITDQAGYFTALQADGANSQNTQVAYRLAELEGGGNSTTAEYSSLISSLSTGGITATDSTTALAAIATAQSSNASTMASSLANAQIAGINAETYQGIADAYLGADMGAEMANLTKYQILMQAGTSALNNANQAAQTVMSLFR